VSSSGGITTTVPRLTVTGAWSMPSRAVAVNTAMSATDFELLVTTGAGPSRSPSRCSARPGLGSRRRQLPAAGVTVTAPARTTLTATILPALGAAGR